MGDKTVYGVDERGGRTSFSYVEKGESKGPGTSGAVFILGICVSLRDIPLICKEGVYSAADFNEDINGNNAISFDYDAQYQILTYDIPVGNGKREMMLYSVPEDDLIRTLRAVYGKDATIIRIVRNT